MRPLKFAKTWVMWLFLLSGVLAQEWGPMQFIDFDEYPPISSPGIFNPSFCDNDSMMYFDGFLRLGYIYPEIWNARFDGIICHNAMALPYPINLPEQQETYNAMPAISKSGDTLFFCSNRPGTYGRFDIWMSIKEDNIWSEPVNLGDSVNSELDELSPHYVSEINTLFFDRLEQQIGLHFGLYSSEYLEDSTWTEALRMPDIINPADYGGSDAYYNVIDSTLYFNYRYSDNIYFSKNLGESWTEPQILEENVNGLWIPNVNNWVATRGACLSSDGHFLFYSKDIWEYSCIDFTSALFFSERTVNINDLENIPVNLSLDINIYPNPSNSSFSISVTPMTEPYDLLIYNLLGRLVREYDNCTLNVIIWDSTDNNNNPVSSGLYFVKVFSGEEVATEKLVLQK